MSHSLNEIEALAKRAARGAGLSWGMSEEAAKAVRWLESHDLPGVTLLAELLTQNDKIAHRNVAPKSLDGIWQAPSGTLCPLVSGAALNDSADQLIPNKSIEMANVSYPLLIVPFAAWAAQHIEAPVAVSWLDVRVSSDGYRLWRDGPQKQIDTAGPVSLFCAPANDWDGTATRPAQRGNVHLPDWARLNTFAHRTYAPATEESRLLGAGVGVSDND